MTRIVFSTLLVICSFSLNAQVEYLRLSPSQLIQQRVGATDVSIEYSRPQMKGRTIFGSLLPYGKLWRAGANENTKISFDHRVSIGGVDVPAGSYSLFAQPFKESWKIFLYDEIDQLDVPEPFDSIKIIAQAIVPTTMSSKLEETLVVNIYDITETSATLGIDWEYTSVRLPIIFYTREAMEKKIQKELDQNIFDYSIVASYYTQRDIELEKAKEMQELSIRLREKPNSWSYNSYGVILYKLKEFEKAKEAFEYSLKLAFQDDNDYLIGENKKMLEELNKMKE